MNEVTMPEGCLQGLRILDFTWVLAGPYATRLLADFGAEVIKVQSRKTAVSDESNATGYFNTWNRNKLGITLDMSSAEGRDLARRLAQACDVVAENFTPRVMSNWGLDYPNLKKVRPDVIMVSLSGMGQTGPWRDSAAFAPTIQALSGMTYLTSFAPDRPLGPGYSYADHVSGLFAALAVLAALEYRDRTGKGQHIDLSEYEAMCVLLGPALMEYVLNGTPVPPHGNTPDYTSAAPHGCYRCLGDDRWCVISVHSVEEWQAFCRALGSPVWANEDRFTTLAQRRENASDLDRLVEQWTATRSREEVVQCLQQAGVLAAAVNDASDLAQDPQLAAREFFVSLKHPLLGETRMDGSPLKLSRTPARFRRAAPLLGQDNGYVFRELLGLSEAELTRYVERGVIA